MKVRATFIPSFGSRVSLGPCAHNSNISLLDKVRLRLSNKIPKDRWLSRGCQRSGTQVIWGLFRETLGTCYVLTVTCEQSKDVRGRWLASGRSPGESSPSDSCRRRRSRGLRPLRGPPYDSGASSIAKARLDLRGITTW